MKTHWIVEKDLKEEEFIATLSTELTKRDIGLTMASYIQIGEPDKLIAKIEAQKDKFVVPIGSIEFCKFFKRYNLSKKPEDRIKMGLFFDLDAFSYYKYSSNWGKYLLNEDAVTTTYAELIRRKDFFYSILGQGDAIFIRPVHNDKVFTGRLIYKEDFDNEIRRMGHNFIVDFPLDLEIVVSSPKNVHKEWRFFICDRKCINSTLYYTNCFEDHVLGCDNQAVLDMVKDVLQEKWQPDDMYVLDMCITKQGNPYVLEIGSMNCAGWYAMQNDVGTIINAIEEWKNIKLNKGEI